MLRSCTLLILLPFLAMPVLAQERASYWYFGELAGIRFNGGNPSVLTDGQLATLEGVASMADGQGHLLFYTDGTRIWNAQHTVMPNGQGLGGNFSSTQSALVVPKIGDPQRYYVFTVGISGYPAEGLKYSVVNMSLDNGRGDVELKNIPLVTPACEKITAVQHCNGRDIWVITHSFNTNDFYAYPVTPAGISAPVISAAGTVVTDAQSYHAMGCLKVSPDGKHIAAAHGGIGVDVLDFNNTTGIVSNGRPVFLPSDPYWDFPGAYGVEFSPNTKMLYITAKYFDVNENQNTDILLQYDVSIADPVTMRASKYIVYKQLASSVNSSFGALQLGPDGKIYMAEVLGPGLSVINRPDLTGTACQFVFRQLITEHINGGHSMYGLPTFIQSYFRPGFTFRGNCIGNLMHFDYQRAPYELSVKWDFGDPASGSSNTSTLDSSQHFYAAEGIYTVKLIRYTSCGSDTISKTVNAGVTLASLGSDTVICGATQYVIAPQTSGVSNSYLWQNGSTAPSFTATQNGLYWVEVRNNVNGCSRRDSINIVFKPVPQFSLGADVHKCAAQPVVLSSPIVGDAYIWNTGVTVDSIRVIQPGTYWLEVNKNGCAYRDSIQVNDHQLPFVDLGKDTTLCEGQTILLDAQNAGMQYQWQNHSTAQTFTVTRPGKYWVRVNNHNCTATDSINIGYLQKPVFTLGDDVNICPGMTLTLQPKIEKGAQFSYAWSNGLTDASIKVTQPGLYALTLSNRCGMQADEMEMKKGACVIYVPGAFTPNGDGQNDMLKAYFGENVTGFEFQVRNRWGETVFSTRDIKTGWDGMYKGRLQSAGVYVWHIRYKTVLEDKEQVMTGTVVLVR